jgi:ATP-dependent Clp protease ATP-binding subunit ClpA
VGKTALARELAWRWQERAAGRIACRVEFVTLLAGAQFAADLNARLRVLYEAALALSSTVLVVLEEFQRACGRLGGLALAQAIEAGLPICGTAGWHGYRELKVHPGLRRRLHLIDIPEPSRPELMDGILPAVAEHLEGRYGVKISRQALALALQESEPLYGAQPGKVIRALDCALAQARRRKLPVLGPDDVIEAAAGSRA